MNGRQPRARPRHVEGRTHRVVTGCGNIYITVNHDEEGLLEVFADLGKSGQCGSSQIEGICRAVSLGLRAGVDPNSFVKQLKGIRCPSPGMDEGTVVLSCSDAISIALQNEIDQLGGEHEVSHS